MQYGRFFGSKLKRFAQIDLTNLLVGQNSGGIALGDDSALIKNIGAMADAERFPDIVIGD